MQTLMSVLWYFVFIFTVLEAQSYDECLFYSLYLESVRDKDNQYFYIVSNQK